MKRFLDFVHQKGEVYLDRETRLAFRYFQNPGSVPLFNKLNRGGPIKRLLSVVSNVAWDMSVPRFMERMLPTKLQGDYTIPFFLSFDRALCETIRAFPIKAAVLDSQSGTVESLPETNSFAYFEREGCGEIFREFSSPDNRLERLSRQVAEPEEILRRIRTEYREVTRLLG